MEVKRTGNVELMQEKDIDGEMPSQEIKEGCKLSVGQQRDERNWQVTERGKEKK